MATNLQTISRALRIIGVLDIEESASASMGTVGLAAMNSMLSRWEANNLPLGFSTQTSLSTTTPVPDEALVAVAFNLAVELAPEFGVVPTTFVASKADMEYRRLLNDPFIVTPSDPSGLPGARSRWNINTDS